MNDLTSKVAIVTGASSGIGRASALLFAKAGAKLVVAARRKDELANLVEEIQASGGEAVALPGDVREESYARDLVDLAVSEFGGLDIGFNNAGIMGEMATAPDLSETAWRDTLDTNLTSAFLGAKYQIPAMLKRGSGSLIFTSSFVGYTAGMPGMAAYAASKAGLIGLVQSLAVEVGSENIRVNALLPGGTRTQMYTDNYTSEEEIAFVNNLHGLKRIAEPEEVGRVAVFLASSNASFVTGSAMLVDGGVSITRT